MSNVAKLEHSQPKRKLLQQLADRYGVEPDIFERTVSSVAMPNPHTREELISCLIVANEHDLNPLTKEIHFMRDKTGRIHPIVGVDGWVKKLNTHPQFDGFDFEHERDADGKLLSVTCKIYRKDRAHPVVATELLSECIRLPGPNKGPNAWNMTPSRMLRHRALMQATRYAIGFAGVMDQDEFERWQEMRNITPKPQRTVEDIPEPDKQPDTAGLQNSEKAQQEYTKSPDDKPDIQPDAEYLANIDAAMWSTTDLDTLNEVLVHNETETDDRGLEQSVRDLYEKHRVRIYDRMDR